MGADPSVVGSTIRLNGQPVTIVGVGPEKLSGSYAPVVTDFWLSISATPVGGAYRAANLERREDHWYDVKARLAPGVSLERAQASMSALALVMGEAFPDLDRGRGITVFRSTDVRFHPESDIELYSGGGLLAAIVFTLLLLACANLANLLLARGIGRSGEMAVRRALGASTGSVARLFLVEALLLSVVGGLFGVLLARWALSALHALPLPYPLSATMQLSIDWRVGVFAVALMAATGILSGLAPALRSARQDVARALRDDRRSSPTGRGTVRVRNALVAVQVGASLVLILGAGLLGRSLAALQNVDTGVDAGRVAWLVTTFGRSGLSGDAAAATLDELLARMATLPGATRAAAASRLPAQRTGTTTTIVEGYTPPNGTGAVELDYTIVTPEYFETIGLPVLEGRAFTASDVQGAERVVVISEAAARSFWGGVDPVGRRLRSQSQPDFVRTVVGVVGNAPVSSLTESTRPMFYAPFAQSSVSSPYILVRSDGDPHALLGAMREQVHDVRTSLPVLEQGTLASHFDDAMAGPRFAARLMGGVSVLAMLLAGLGTYAVVAFSVARRSGELGIRMALGAAQGRVVRMVLGETAGTVALGLAAGVAVAALAAPRIESVLFGVVPLDPLTYASAVLLLGVVAAIAAYVPARRAARANPVRSLQGS
jgi:predicted permease